MENQSPRKRFVRLPEVMARTGYRSSNIYLLMSEGQFPQSVRLGSKAVGWLESEVDEWMQRRIDQRDNASAPKVV